MNQFKEEKGSGRNILAGVILIGMLLTGTLLCVNWDRWIRIQTIKPGHITWDMDMAKYINMVCEEADIDANELTFLGTGPEDGEYYAYFNTPVDGNCNRYSDVKTIWRRPTIAFTRGD